MRLLGATVAVALALVLPGSAQAERGPEGCRAFNPVAPTCSFTVTHTSHTPITGVGGMGTWIVIIKRDGETLRFKSLPDGRPTIYEIAFKVGDKVTAKALEPGSGLTVGHDD